MKQEAVDFIKKSFEIKNLTNHNGKEYFDIVSENEEVWLRFEEDTFFLMKSSQGFCEMIPTKIKSALDIEYVQELFDL